MISVDEALDLINKHISETTHEMSRLSDLTGRVSATEIYSPINLPPFEQAAMDGFAVKFHLEKNNTYTVIGELAAGSPEEFNLQPGQAVRIFTGAKTPSSADAIVMQEYCKLNNELMEVNIEIHKGDHIRPSGYQIKLGELAIPKNTIFNPFAVGLVANMGLEKAIVYRKPNIIILTTGSELTKPGEKLGEGKIYESNSFMLHSALLYYTGISAEIIQVNDDIQLISNQISEAIDKSDFILISGGISGGDYDFVGRALNDNQVEGVFYKVRQKPGKPLYFGLSENKSAVFALPGNPSAAITTFLIYVLPAINKFIGKGFKGLQKVTGVLNGGYIKNDNRAHFLKASFQNGEIIIHDGQNSDILKSFIEASCIAYVPEEKTKLFHGETVDVFLL